MYDDYNGRMREDEVSCTLTPNTGSSTERNGQKVVLPVLTPDRTEKRQNGRRFKENGDPAFTLTSEDRHEVAIEVEGNYMPSGHSAGNVISRGGVSPTVMENRGTVSAVTVRVKEATKQGYAVARGGQDSINLSMPESRTRRGRVGVGMANTLDCGCEQGVAIEVDGKTIKEEHPGMFVELSSGAIVYAVWYPKYECYVAIRKLTPRECFRLQGWEDEYFERAELVNSDSQLYKQAGNGVTVNVVEVIGKRLKEIEDEKHLTERQ